MQYSFRLFFKLQILFLTQFICTSSYASERPLQCDYFRTQEKVICAVSGKLVNVSSITINEGECKSPDVKINEVNSVRNELNKQSPNPLSLEPDFRGRHKYGAVFSFPVDSHCDLKSFVIIANNTPYQWRLNYLRSLIYPNPLPY